MVGRPSEARSVTILARNLRNATPLMCVTHEIRKGRTPAVVFTESTSIRSTCWMRSARQGKPREQAPTELTL